MLNQHCREQNLLSLWPPGALLPKESLLLLCQPVVRVQVVLQGLNTSEWFSTNPTAAVLLVAMNSQPCQPPRKCSLNSASSQLTSFSYRAQHSTKQARGLRRTETWLGGFLGFFFCWSLCQGSHHAGGQYGAHVMTHFMLEALLCLNGGCEGWEGGSPSPAPEHHRGLAQPCTIAPLHHYTGAPP